MLICATMAARPPSQRDQSLSDSDSLRRSTLDGTETASLAR